VLPACLSLVFKFQIVDADGVAVLDAQLLQTRKQAALAQLPVKVHPGLVVAEVDVRHKALQPLAGDDPQVVLLPDLLLVNVPGLGQRLDIFCTAVIISFFYINCNRTS